MGVMLWPCEWRCPPLPARLRGGLRDSPLPALPHENGEGDPGVEQDDGGWTGGASSRQTARW